MPDLFKLYYGEKELVKMPIEEANKIITQLRDEIPIFKSQRYLSEMLKDNNGKIKKDNRYSEIMGNEKFLIVDDMFKDIKEFEFEGFEDITIVFVGENMNVNSIITDGNLFLVETFKELYYIECLYINITKEQPKLSMLFCFDNDIDKKFIPNIKLMDTIK